MNLAIRTPIALLMLMLLGGFAGCTVPPQPQLRSGSLPFPGLFTLYEPFNAEDVDGHSYSVPPVFKKGSKGIVYTEHGGFIDIAHVRWTVDWGGYYHARVHRALSQSETSLTLPTDKFSRFALTFDYPEDWHTLSQGERAQRVDEIALRLGQELAWTLGHWHEIATFYGYATLVVVSEYESAFAYCDTFSHLLGLRILEDALAYQREDYDRDYDDAVTAAFFDHLYRLNPFSVAQTYAAIDAVEGRWWIDRRMLRRQLALGLEGEPIRPWLIPNNHGEPGRYGEASDVPGMHDLADPAYRNFVTIQIQPRILEANTIRAAAGAEGNLINPEKHFPPIIEDIRRRHQEAYGPGTTQP
ncbi:MAG: DUF4056 domain-containing protein [Phycisphaeraceae bacterium]